MGLKVHLVTPVTIGARTEYMIEAHFHHRGSRQIGGDVTTHPGSTIGALQHHGDRVPANDVGDPSLQVNITGIGRLILQLDSVLVRSVERSLRQHQAPVGQMLMQFCQQLPGRFFPTRGQHIIQRIEPLHLLIRPLAVVIWRRPDSLFLHAAIR